MNTALFRKSAVLVLVSCLSLTLPHVVHAQTLTLPQPFKHEGLSFSSPLNFEKTGLLVKSISLEFGTVDEIDVQPTTKQQIAIETIVTPTPTPSTITTADLTAPAQHSSTIPSPTASLEKSPTPTSTPTPMLVTPTTTPQVITSPSNPGGLNADTLFNMVNAYRENKGLPAFQKDEKACSLAASRAPEINNEVATNTMHSGLRARNLPYWNTENIISMRNETEAFNWWINDQIHKDAIESNNTYSCMACSGNSCAEEFTNYQPK
ncbi:hypothetical protein BH09PAT1_BH09PAT1_0150 [soil metagenome]